MAIGSSLLQAIKNVAKHAHQVYYCVFHKDQSLKVIQCLLKVTSSTKYKKYMVSTKVVFVFCTKLSGIDPCEKRNNILGGHA